MDKTQKRLLLISLGISITVLFLFLFFTIDKETLQALESANIWLILLALLMHIVSIGFWALRIQFMSKSLGYKIPFLHLFNLVCSNQFLASVTPSQVGGEPIRIYELVKAKVPIADAT
ncbi:MAG TPA: flippase-like domain-containing protein, partial [Methanocorpusculum sp.]|nr:flippase-like domain-containing protein [Methanocorpusculum sp.]